MKVGGFSIKPTTAGRELPAAWRFYGTREVVKDDAGRERPHPNRWRLVREVRAEWDGENFTLPAFNLDRTEPGRWRFYNPVIVYADGRELWHADNEIMLTRATVKALGGAVDFAGLLLWNLEQQGVIAPGQLRD